MTEKPKKERRFIKAMGRVGEILIQEVLIKIGSNLIKKIGGKKTLPSILFLLASLSLFSQFPNTGNKQRLGFQTTGDGLTWRGSISDTASIQPVNNQNAWVILDTVNLKIYSFDFTSNVWNLVGGGSAAFTQPVDSLFFNVNVPTNNVDTAKMRWDSDLGTVVLGMYDKVPNELGFKNFWLVKNQTGSTITKGSIVYANGTVGASGRITVAKFIADGSIDAKYLLGITAHDLTNGEDGYVISFGKIRQVNTDTFAAGAILYPSPTVAGVWTDVEPVAPNIDMPIGFCINSHVNNGTIAIRVASGYKLNELHDVSITSPVDKASLYYTGGLWRDTTAALLTSDTASMLTNYLRSGVAASTYLTQSNAASTYLPLTGGTLTGGLTGTTGTFTSEIKAGNMSSVGSPVLYAGISGSQNEVHIYQGTNDGDDTTTLRLTNNNGIYYQNGLFLKSIMYRGLDEYYAHLGIMNNNFITFRENSRIGIFQSSPSYTLDVNGTFNASGNSLIGGTLGVTGATTLTGGINGDTKFNNGNVAIRTSHSSNWPNTYSILELGNGNTYNTIWGSSGGDGGANSYGQSGIGNNNNFNKYYGNGAASFLVQSGGRLSYWTAPNGLAGETISFIKKLEIDANTTSILTSRLNVAGGNQNSILLNNAANGTTSGFLIGRSFATNNSQDLFIYDIENAAFRLNINSSGNLGIGTTNPVAKLEVHGSAVFNEASAIADFRVESDGDAYMLFVDGTNNRVGIGTNAPDKTLHVNGEVKIATVTATPTSLLGKDGSNVVGEVTTVAQTGLMKAGGTTTNTSSVGIITVAHGLSYTPTQVLVTLAQQNSYVIVCHGINSTNLLFTVYDSVTGNALNDVSVGFFWLAIK